MPHRVILIPDDLEALGRVLASLKLPITVQWKAGRDRSLDQNALMWMWAAESAAQRGDQTADETQREWKLVHGVPILRAEDAEFCQFYDQHLKRKLTHKEKLDAMRYLPITSIMTVKQMTTFLDIVHRECAEQGIKLTDPETT